MKTIFKASLRDALIFTSVWLIGRLVFRGTKIYHLLLQAYHHDSLFAVLIVILGIYVLLFILIFLVLLCYRSIKWRLRLKRKVTK
ncbi:hypothetical protein [Bombilactobacillus bombi]|uniref:hypothetical protein n=1 Tax=Bombilactobacillus bombi TaxID=1303590 RepID=UPI0015E5AA80|nr:hypothetical protein [Bombilactobacillus bombi]MBA1434658.1 hypothetical protein [Bombilactobacillus bombi]